MAKITMADISEYQTNIDAPTYLRYHKTIICRVHNGNRPDNMMPTRRDYLRKYKFTGIGWYQYLVSNRDPAAQARDFIAVVGNLHVNEWAILDLESGTGDQTQRAQAWFDVVDKWANMTAMLYSGEYFLNNQLGGSGRWKGRPIWVAAYRSTEPTLAHMLWQYTDREKYGAITPSNCDSSLHHGTDKSFIYDVRHARSGG